MKRIILIVLSFLLMLVGFGCERNKSVKTDYVATVEDRVSVDSQNMIRLHTPLQWNEAEVYPEPWNDRCEILSGELPAEENLTKDFTVEQTQTGFLIDGEAYSELPDYGEWKTLDGDGATQRFHRWTFDCAFLRYEGKSKDYKVYVPEANDNTGVLVLVGDSDQWLLAKNDSALHEKQNMYTEQFETCQIGGKYYTETSVFPHIIQEIMNDDAVPSMLPSDTLYNNMPFTFEWMSVPGLALTVHILAFPNGENYAYNQKINAFVKLSDSIDFDITLNYRKSQNNARSTMMNGKVLAAQIPEYDSDGVYAKWSSRQYGYRGEYVFNWKAENNRITVKQLTEIEYEIEGKLYNRVPIAEADSAGWKIDLGLFRRYGISRNDTNLDLLTNTESEIPDCVILFSEKEKVFLMESDLSLPTGTALQAGQLGLCWINNGIILPAIDAASLIPLLKDRQSQSDIPVRFESIEYPGLSYCGWITEEEYGHIVNQL